MKSRPLIFLILVCSARAASHNSFKDIAKFEAGEATMFVRTVAYRPQDYPQIVFVLPLKEFDRFQQAVTDVVKELTTTQPKGYY